ncbi:MAG: hypothetical protein Q4G28_00010 [Neisseria sp.]|nr:hypothetical protein [Neisseria sp.]
MIIETIKYSLPLMLIAIGWIVVHQLNIHRDRKNKQADLRLQFLLEAYRRLEFSANRDIVSSEEFMRNHESAIADIQLLGNSEQISAILKYINNHARNGSADISNVLELLRQELREELNLSNEKEKIVVFRFKRPESKPR